MTQHLTVEELLFIHYRVLCEHQAYNADFAIDNMDKLKSMLADIEQIDENEKGGNVYSKAAHLLNWIITNKPFEYGSTLVGIVAAMVFMENNGFESVAGDEAILELVEKTKNKEWGEEVISRWFESLYIQI